MTNLASVDPKLFAVCVRECAQSACALVGVGRNPVAKELADLFAGPIADVLVPFAAGVTNGNGRGETRRVRRRTRSRLTKKMIIRRRRRR